ncbi:MAG: tRNA lysidine(34) synthetase TilS [Gammaproteobacteria bacterium]
MSLKKSLSENDLLSFNRIGVAYSGGLDSHVLLKLVTELNIDKKKIFAIHVNHGINASANEWESHSKRTCEELGVNFCSYKLDIPSNSTEETMRYLRYGKFKEWFERGDVLLTAHHQQDQTETILFRIFRGTGIKGLGGIPGKREEKGLLLIRPLLSIDKSEIFNYAKKLKLKWVEDSSNNNEDFSRNFIRNNIIPRLTSKWPSLNKALKFLSEESIEKNSLLNEIGNDDLKSFEAKERIQLNKLNELSDLRKKNALRCWLESHQINPSHKVFSEIFDSLIPAKDDSSPLILLSGFGEKKWQLRKYNHEIFLLPEEASNSDISNININWDMKKELNLPTGILKVSKAGGRISEDLLKNNIKVKGRIGGEKFCLEGISKSHSLKQFYQENNIPPWTRNRVPLIYLDTRLIMIPNLWVSEEVLASEGEKGIDLKWKDKLSS